MFSNNFGRSIAILIISTIAIRRTTNQLTIAKMIFTTLYALSFAALAVAQSSSTTVSIILPNADTMSSLVGSIAGSDASATTYVIGCASTTSAPAAAASTGANSSNLVYADPQNGCGFDQSQTITQGFSTFHWIFSESQMCVIPLFLGLVL